MYYGNYDRSDRRRIDNIYGATFVYVPYGTATGGTYVTYIRPSIGTALCCEKREEAIVLNHATAKMKRCLFVASGNFAIL